MKKRVLLIENDDSIRETTSIILELSNYFVKTADSSLLGIQIAQDFIPDIIICALKMPKIDGLGVLQVFTKSSNLAAVPFILLLPKSTKYSIFRKAMELGADDCVYKPFDESELLRSIESRLQRIELFRQKIQFHTVESYKYLNTINTNRFLNEFLTHEKKYNYKKGDTIYCQGNLSNHIFLIKSGTIKTYLTNANGKEFITGYFSENQYFGYCSFLNQKEHFENATALTNTVLYKIHKKGILEILNNNATIMNNFIKMLTLSETNRKEQLMLMAYGSVREKTAKILIQLMNQNLANSENKITISRSNMAKTIGIAKETLTRTLHDFKDERLIEFNTKSISILNKKKLLKVY